MNENQKTITYVVVGALALLIGFKPWGARTTQTPEVEAGQKLFPDFTNALSATSLEIIDFDEDTSTLKPFQISQVDGVWRIPSHQNYPADAKDHLAAAATALIDLDILGVAGDSPGEQEVFGVIEPDIKTLKAGTTGVGRRVIMKDSGGNTLADLIIGKDVKDQPAVKYVRKTGKDPIYRVAIKTDKLTTKFDDWIEKDLLKLNPMDIRELAVNDYSLKEVNAKGRPAIGMLRASEMKLGYDDSKSAWTLEDLVEYKENKPVESKLAEDEELDTQKLNDMRNALDDLKIVDVERKPKGLNPDLSVSEELAKDQEGLDELSFSLAKRGFLPVSLDESRLTIVSSEGEVLVKLKDGVAYVVRFGEVSNKATGGDDKADKKDQKADAGRSRYVMITAQVDDSSIPKPELKPLPGEEEKAEEAPKDDAEKATDKKEEPAAKDDKAKKPEDSAAKKADDEALRAAIEKENKRKQDEYDEKIKKANDKVKELNDRFADWYYVIADDVYKKIHLTRADIVKKKEKKTGEGDGVSDFKDLDKGLGSEPEPGPEPESK